MKAIPERNNEISTGELIALSDVTARMLQWWIEHTSLFEREKRVGHGSGRYWSKEEAIFVCVIVELRYKHMPLRFIRPMVERLRVLIKARERWIITDGAKVIGGCSDASRCVSIARSLQGALVVDLDKIVKRVEARFAVIGEVAPVAKRQLVRTRHEPIYRYADPSAGWMR